MRSIPCIGLVMLGFLGVVSASCGGDDNAVTAVDAGPDASASDATTTDGAVANPYDGLPVDQRVQVAGLRGPVDVVRDHAGMVHIRATTAVDAFRVEGYQIARDRTAQLELVRRSATGRLAEIFGALSPAIIDSDIAVRTIGLARVAKEMYDALPADGETRAWLDAYADGVTQFNARVVSGAEPLPAGLDLLTPDAFQPWTAVDVLAVARFQAMGLGYQADSELAMSAFVDAARTTFSATAADPLAAQRAGFVADFVRFAPIDPATPLAGFPNDLSHTLSSKAPPSAHPASVPTGPIASARSRPARNNVETPASRAALAATRGFREAMQATRLLLGDKGFTGSNDWVVAPSRTATGHAMLANDPHLALSAPALFWMVHLEIVSAQPSEAMNVAGIAFPGIPGIILGFNEHIAWGATTADYDVTDVYREQVTSDHSGVVFRGATVPFRVVHESIGVQGGSTVEMDVRIVPHHGPIVPNIQGHNVVAPDAAAFSVRWTGHQPTKDIDAIFALLRSKNVDDARNAFRGYAIGAQNWVVADTSGDIFYTTQSAVPKRDKGALSWDPTTFSGTIPCLVLPGDGTAEWTGQLVEEAYLPHVKNPAKGYLATANNDQVGVTLDNDPTNDKLPNGETGYLGCSHDPGFRAARISQRIETVGHLITLDDMATIQADARSATGALLAPKLLLALDHAAAEKATPGAHPDLAAVVAAPRYTSANLAEARDLMTRWAESDYDAASGMSPDTNTPVPDAKEATASRATAVFNVWLAGMINATFSDEIAALGVATPPDLAEHLIYLMTADPTKLKTFRAAANDSVVFDDMRTATIESRDDRAVTSLLDALDYLKTKLGPDSQAWRWGRLHTLQIRAAVPLWTSLAIPPQPDPVFPNGFPRHGDGYNVDVGGYSFGAPLASIDFSYRHGPVQRFVIDMDPSGPVARNVIPGGNVWDSTSPHFRDQVELWRRNQNRAIPFGSAAVVKDAERRAVYAP